MAAGLRSVFASGFFSFPKGTLIWTEDGFKPIEQIAVGDLVWSRDENDPDGSNVLNPVTELFQRTSSDMSVLTLKTAPQGISNKNPLILVSDNPVVSTRQVRLTPEHPVFVIDRGGLILGWVTAGELASGDMIADIDGGEAVKVVSNKLTSVSQTVYNFEVAGNHNYFADELGLWVHNAKGGRQKNVAPSVLLERSRRGLRLLKRISSQCNKGQQQEVIRRTAKRLGFNKRDVKATEKQLIRGTRK